MDPMGYFPARSLWMSSLVGPAGLGEATAQNAWSSTGRAGHEKPPCCDQQAILVYVIKFLQLSVSDGICICVDE